MMPLMAAQELVKVQRQTAEYDGSSVAIDTGQPLLHVVRGNDMTPLCGAARRRLLPTGWHWFAEPPPHMRRCAVCMDRFPPSGG